MFTYELKFTSFHAECHIEYSMLNDDKCPLLISMLRLLQLIDLHSQSMAHPDVARVA